MKNKVLEILLDLKQQELNTLRNVTEKYVPNSLYAYEKIDNFVRPAFGFGENLFSGFSSKNVKVLIDEPLNSEMKRLLEIGNGKISDVERFYDYCRRSNESSSFDLVGHFPEEYGIRDVKEVLCTAGHLVNDYLLFGSSAIVSNLLDDKQENLDLGLVILKKPMIKGVYEPEVAYNVHLEFKRRNNGKVVEIHIHIFEFPRSFKENRYGLI